MTVSCRKFQDRITGKNSSRSFQNTDINGELTSIGFANFFNDSLNNRKGIERLPKSFENFLCQDPPCPVKSGRKTFAAQYNSQIKFKPPQGIVPVKFAASITKNILPSDPGPDHIRNPSRTRKNTSFNFVDYGSYFENRKEFRKTLTKATNENRITVLEEAITNGRTNLGSNGPAGRKIESLCGQDEYFSNTVELLTSCVSDTDKLLSQKALNSSTGFVEFVHESPLLTGTMSPKTNNAVRRFSDTCKTEQLRSDVDDVAQLPLL